MKISSKQNFLPGVIICLFFITNSCLDDRYDFNKISDEIEITPKLAAPVAYGTLTVADILDEFDEAGQVNEFDDKLLYITYSDYLYSLTASDIIDIPDQTFIELYIDSEFGVLPGFGIGETISVNKEKNGEFVFLNNERIDSIFLKNTILQIEVNSSFRHRGKLNILSPNIIINGSSFAEQVVISEASGNFSQIINIPLEGSRITLDNSNPDTTYLPLNFELELINSGAGISPGDKCNITMKFLNVDFYSVYGYIGDYELLIDAGGINVDLFDSDLEEGTISFYDPQVHIEVTNSYGIPVSVELLDVVASSVINTTTPTMPITFTGVNPFLIDAPEIPGENVVTSIIIDRNVSNIHEGVDIQPNIFIFKANAISNPPGSVLQNNFVTDSSSIDLSFMIVLPIWIKAEGFSLRDTVELNIEDNFGELTEFIKYLEVTFDASNGLPLEVDLQLYFADENYQIIDSMFVDNKAFIEPASVDANDKVTVEKELSHSFGFTESRLESIRETKYAIINAFAYTPNADENKFVKFFSDYKIDYKLKLKADFYLNSKKL